jgi:hypothetical protein
MSLGLLVNVHCSSVEFSFVFVFGFFFPVC